MLWPRASESCGEMLCAGSVGCFWARRFVCQCGEPDAVGADAGPRQAGEPGAGSVTGGMKRLDAV